MKPFLLESCRPFRFVRLGARRLEVSSAIKMYSPSQRAVIEFAPGIRTDGGSIPLWMLTACLLAMFAAVFSSWALVLAALFAGTLAIQRYGRWLPGFAMHDELYRTGVVRPLDVAEVRVITRAQADAILNEAGIALGVNPVERAVVMLGLRIGGWRQWNKYRRAEMKEKHQ